MTALRRVLTGGLLLLSAVGTWSQPAFGLSAIEVDPAHKVLFESGFYAQTLDYVAAQLAREQDSVWEDLQTYRAFSLIMLDLRDSAVAVFDEVLHARPTYALNPVYTSPKLYEVFLIAQQRHRPRPPDSLAQVTTPADSAVPAVNGSVVSDSATVRQRRDGYRVALHFLPGAAGQFYNRQPAKGAVLLITQVLALGASILTYSALRELYDPQFGWYEGNGDAYRSYSYSYRIEFGIAALAYAYSVVDAFVVDGRARRRARLGQGEVR